MTDCQPNARQPNASQPSDCQRTAMLLDDYADGELATTERAAIRRHLDSCARCDALWTAYGTLASAIGTLPAAIAPQRDLWPGIEGRLAIAGAVAGGLAGVPKPRRQRYLAGMAAAAAVVLAVLSVFVVGHTSTVKEVATGHGQPTSPAIAELYAAEEAYLEAAANLTRALDRARDELSPETQAVFTANLEIIDAAIGDARAALVRDPGNVRLADLLNQMYRDKLALLRDAARVAQRNQKG